MISRMIDCVSVTQKQLRNAQSLEEAGPKINKEISLIMAFIEGKVDKILGFLTKTATYIKYLGQSPHFKPTLKKGKILSCLQSEANQNS